MKHTSNYGKYRAPNCECTYNFTCRTCLDNAPKYFWTPNKISDLIHLQDIVSARSNKSKT